MPENKKNQVKVIALRIKIIPRNIYANFLPINAVSGSSFTLINNLINLIGLEDLNISGNLYINNNNIEDITSLNKLTTINGNFDLSNNVNLSDLTGIENVSNITGDLLIDDPIQYTVKPDVSSNFCNAVANDSFQVIVKETTRGG